MFGATNDAADAAAICEAAGRLVLVPNQNLFRVAKEKTTFADAFAMADQVLCSGISCITDLMVKEELVNLDFADVCSIVSEMGTAMIGTGEATGERRALRAAEGAIANPLFDDTSLKGARGLLISMTGGKDLTLYEVDEAASRIRQEVDDEANIIVGATFELALEDACGCRSSRRASIRRPISGSSYVRSFLSRAGSPPKRRGARTGRTARTPFKTGRDASTHRRGHGDRNPAASIAGIPPGEPTERRRNPPLRSSPPLWRKPRWRVGFRAGCASSA